MKKFATYLKVTLTKKPEWFDSFYERYSQPHEMHITLTQPRHIDETRVEDVKIEIDKVLKNNVFKDTDKHFIFDTFVYDKEPDGTYTVMLITQGSSLLNNLQKDLRENLSQFGNYVDAVMEDYETKFRPHLTVGNNIGVQDIQEVENYLNKQNSFVEGVTGELVLVAVENVNIAETKDSNNLTIFTI